jgi:hypothetical protein
MPVKWASVEDVERAIASWSPEVLMCRKAKHSFREQVHATRYPDFGYWRVIYRCVGECDVKQWQEWNLNGRVLASGLIYPKDADGNELYLMPPGWGRVDADGYDLIRLETQRQLGYTEVTGADEEDLPHSQVARLAVQGHLQNGARPKRGKSKSRNKNRSNHLKAV